MESINACSREDLIAALAQINISVPLRTEGRTTDHCERWSICRLLASVADTGFLEFPMSLVHQDRPDFHIKHASQEIGIEITEVVPENDAAIDAYREHRDIDGPFFMKRHRPNDARLRGEELHSAATSRQSGDGWGGDSVEREWVAAMREFIVRKVAKSAKAGFRLFTENWLLMYDNWSLPALDRDMAAKMLFCSLSSTDFGPFQRIWIESGNQIWCISPAELHPLDINDLWCSS